MREYVRIAKMTFRSYIYPDDINKLKDFDTSLNEEYV